MLKQTLIAGAALALAAVPAFAHHHSGSTTISHSFNDYSKSVSVNNSASVDNTTVTVANTGLNFTGTMNSGSTTANTTTGEAEKGSQHDIGGQANGGANTMVQTGDAGAKSVVVNDVNSTTVSF